MTGQLKNHSLDLPELELVEDGLRALNCQDNPGLSEVTGYILAQGGKRIRPTLVFLCSGVYGASLQSRVDIALAAELIHSASLLHDDVVDESPLRRGLISANTRWGNPTAVLAGDYLFSRAYSILSRYPTILAIMTEAIATMCLGELKQLQAHFNPDTTPTDYVRTILGKTASLLAASCCCGASLSAMPPEEIEVVEKFGVHLGIAYQIIDDITDYVWEPDRTGKPHGGDIRNGVITLPIMYLLANPATSARVRALLKQKNPLEPSLLAPELAATRAIEKAGAVACQYLERCLSLLAQLPQQPPVFLLAAIVQEMLSRSKTLSDCSPAPQPPGQRRQSTNPASG